MMLARNSLAEHDTSKAFEEHYGEESTTDPTQETIPDENGVLVDPW